MRENVVSQIHYFEKNEFIGLEVSDDLLPNKVVTPKTICVANGWWQRS